MIEQQQGLTSPDGITYRLVPIEWIIPNPENYNQHPVEQIEALKADFKRFGQVKPYVVKQQNETTFMLSAGEGCTIAARELVEEEPETYAHLGTAKIVIVPDWWTDDDVTGFMAADNETARMSYPDEGKLIHLLQHQQEAGYDLHSLGTDEEALRQMLDTLADEALGLNGEVERPEKGKQPNPRVLPLDVIYTLQMADCTCCLAVQAGLKYGIQSAHYRLCPYTYELTGRHEVVFIDNDYFHYDHAVHLAAVKEFHPRYATVKDIMTKAQCTKDGIEWTPIEQILDWAEELSEHAENIIVIPKYDCIADIPQKFMLGYSIPTSHGGTPLPVDLFRGRRIHLLGGSWKAQLSYMAEFGEDVVSVDNNQIQLIAGRFGEFTHPDGETQSLTEAGLGKLTNPRYAALALSFGSIGAKVQELYAVEEAIA